MKTALLEFQRSLADLKALLQHDKHVDLLLGYKDKGDTPTVLSSLLSDLRNSADRFVLRQAQYSTQLVLLYGAFERLIEGYIIGYGEFISELVPDFGSLPREIRDSHRRKSVEALNDEVWLSRQTRPSLVSELIENLSSCESGLTRYRLNSVAYARHGANFRKRQIDDMFKSLGVADICNALVSAEPFLTYLEDKPRQVGLLDGSLGVIDDLAERRNEIAHGSPNELLGSEQIDDYLQFFDAFARAIYGVLCERLTQYLVAHHAGSLGRIEKVHYKHVMTFDSGILPQGTVLEVGRLVALELNDPRRFALGEIRNLRLTSGDVQSFRTQQGLEVALQTNLRLRSGRRIYLIEPKTSNVTSLVHALSVAPST